MSELDELELPFQSTEFRGHIAIERNRIRFNFEGYVQALLQKASLSLKRLSEILGRYEELTEEFSHLDDAELVHGKDAVLVFERLLRTHGLRSNETRRLLWCSYERQWIKGYSSLEQAYEFLTSR